MRAYRSNNIRLVDTDLSGCDRLVATSRGLFAIGRQMTRLLAYGAFYGLAVCDDQMFAFEACDYPHDMSFRGRLIRLRREGDRIVAADVIATGLDNGCHQIDIIDDRLCVTDTYNQRILLYPVEGGDPEIRQPITGGRDGDWAQGYAHINSIIARDDHILLLLHNGAIKTGRPSEIAWLDRDWRLIERMPLDGLGCHSLAVLEDGAILTCGSYAGEMISTAGVKVPVCDMMTRGLSVDADTIVVGGSVLADRKTRQDAPGAVFFLDRSYRLLGSLAVPTAPMEIRRIDGRDRSLSRHVAAMRRVERWTRCPQSALTKANAVVAASGNSPSSAP